MPTAIQTIFSRTAFGRGGSTWDAIPAQTGFGFEVYGRFTCTVDGVFTNLQQVGALGAIRLRGR